MNIYEYLDYRLFIKDYCEERIKENPHFSYRYISTKAGIKSSGYLSMIAKGERSLTDTLARKLARVFNLNKREAAYFLSLVHLNQAKSVEERGVFYREILTYQNNPVKTILKDSYELYDKWYYSAIREIVEIYPVYDNFTEISKLLKPSVKPIEVEKAIEVLARLQLIHKGTDGFYRRSDEVISSGKTPYTYIIQQFQIQLLDLAKGAYDRFEKDDRELSAITMSIDQSTYQLMKERLASCRMELLELARNVKNPTRVYQLNMQLHPLSIEKEDSKKTIT
jgi:uncharacterized protein (TIGR02147 family)